MQPGNWQKALSFRGWQDGWVTFQSRSPNDPAAVQWRGCFLASPSFSFCLQLWLTSSCGQLTGRDSKPSWWERASSNTPNTLTSSAGTAHHSLATPRPFSSHHTGMTHLPLLSPPAPSVPSFQSLPEDVLSKLADVLEEVMSPKTLFFPSSLFHKHPLADIQYQFPAICSSIRRIQIVRNALLGSRRYIVVHIPAFSISLSDSLRRLWLHYPSGRHRWHILHHQRRTGEEEGWNGIIY